MVDDQAPHAEYEIYVVLAGHASFTSGPQSLEVGPGTTLFVPAHDEHRFHDVSEDLAVLVVFAPAYRSADWSTPGPASPPSGAPLDDRRSGASLLRVQRRAVVSL